MAYTSTSIKEVLGRVIRNLDNKLPAHYIDSCLEWIPEAVLQLRTPFTLYTASTPNVDCDGEFVTENHAVRLPCGLLEVLSVEDRYGNRVNVSGAQIDITNPSVRLSVSDYDVRVTDFVTSTGSIGTGSEDGPSVPWDGSNITPISNNYIPLTYQIQLDYLQTNLESAFVKINYTALPVDEEGYPLIPDVDEYKEALYWYVMGKLIGTGFKHPVIPSDLNGLEYCNNKFNQYAGRALGEIKMPDQDRVAKLYNSTVRLVPPTHFYGDFFLGSSEVQPIRGI